MTGKLSDGLGSGVNLCFLGKRSQHTCLGLMACTAGGPGEQTDSVKLGGAGSGKWGWCGENQMYQMATLPTLPFCLGTAFALRVL